VGGGCYELLQRCCGLECYPYIGVFEQICDSSYFGAVICEHGPNFVSSHCECDYSCYVSVG
jgi:hypothetical protein